MTSMPASRSARAMIFAPRSWPSRPGLATTTRILRLLAAALTARSLLHDELHLLVRRTVDDAVDRVSAPLLHLLLEGARALDAGVELHRALSHGDRVGAVPGEAPLHRRALRDGDLRHPACAHVVVVTDLDALGGGEGRGGERGERAGGDGDDDQLSHLEHRGFCVGTEHLLKALDDLTLGGVYARAIEKVRHQVAIARGGLAQLRQGGLDRRSVAARAHALHAIGLLALDRGIDAVQLQLSALALGEVVDADHDPSARVVLLLERVGGVGDLALREAALDRLDHPAQLIDLAEVVIGLRLDLIG